MSSRTDSPPDSVDDQLRVVLARHFGIDPMEGSGDSPLALLWVGPPDRQHLLRRSTSSITVDVVELTGYAGHPFDEGVRYDAVHLYWPGSVPATDLRSHLSSLWAVVRVGGVLAATVTPSTATIGSEAKGGFIWQDLASEILAATAGQVTLLEFLVNADLGHQGSRAEQSVVEVTTICLRLGPN